MEYSPHFLGQARTAFLPADDVFRKARTVLLPARTAFRKARIVFVARRYAGVGLGVPSKAGRLRGESAGCLTSRLASEPHSVSSRREDVRNEG